MKLSEFITEYLEEGTTVEVYETFKSNMRGTIYKPKGAGDISYKFSAGDYPELKDRQIKLFGAGFDIMYEAPLLIVVVE